MVNSKKRQLKQAVVSTRPPKVLSFRSAVNISLQPKAVDFPWERHPETMLDENRQFFIQHTINRRLCETNASTGKGLLFVYGTYRRK